MSNKSKKFEEKYRIKQQLASKFTQKSNFLGVSLERKDKKAVSKLANKLCK